MSSHRFAAIFFAIFVLGAFPLLLVQPSGAASAGLSAGFASPVQHIPFMLMFVLIGMWATILGGYATGALPVGVVTMLFIGGLISMDAVQFPYLKQSFITAIVLYAVTASMVRSKLYLMSSLILGVLSFYLGGYYISSVPQSATTAYYLAGIVISNLLILAIGICIGITVVDDMQGWIAKMREKRASSAFLTFFF
jgi:hydrogenase/urease accessory protein HupE